MPTRIKPTKHLFFNALGLAISVIPVTVSIFSYFPIWASRKDSSLLSGISLLLILIALVPFYKHLKHVLRSPSVPLMWFFAFIVFMFLSRISDEMTVISFVGFTTNLIGAFCFRLAKKYTEEDKTDEGQS